MEQKAYSIRVKGKVQHVGFRYHAREAARRFGVCGFIRNEPDGSVYAEVEGKTVAVELFCKWCRKGPDWARVDHTNLVEIPLQNFESFTIKG
ncbi:MAG: acylphosphatase [Marinifilaceae bacterium]